VDLDSAALWLSTRSPEALRKAKDFSLREELFRGAGKVAWRFIHTYIDEHGEMPPPSIITENSGQSIAETEDGVTLTYVLDKMHERAEFLALKYGLGKSLEYLEQGDQSEAVEEVHKLDGHLRDTSMKKVRIHTLAEVMPEVREMYERTKRGDTGIKFPWPTMTSITMGMWPKTLTFFVARPGVGKTFTLINIGDYAHFIEGKSVLIVSPEMSRVELGERHVAIRGKYSYGDIVGATLGNMVEPKFFDTIKTIQADEGYWILDDEERLEPSYIEEAIDATNPDLILVDSVYMLRVAEGKVKGGAGSRGTRADRILSTVDWLRSLCRKTDKPFAAVSQLSREGTVKKGAATTIKKGLGSGGLENAVAMTDTLFWDAHNLFAMYQDKDMKDDKQMLYVPLKARRQANWSAVVTRWDLQTMNFEEIGTKVEAEGSKYNDSQYDDVVY